MSNSQHFTVQDANKMLPLVAAIVGDWSELCRRVAEREKRVEKISNGREPTSDDPYAEELAEVQRELVKSRQRIKEYLRELKSLGVQAGDPTLGTVHFPANAESDHVFCWKLGETEVVHSHAADDGCDSRQKITAEISGSTDDSEGLSE